VPRKGPAKIRAIEPDPVHEDRLVSQLTNKILLSGKKGTAERIVYEALEIIGAKTNDDPVVALRKAVGNVRPMLEVKPRRVGGATYQVPIEVSNRRGTTLALRWIVGFSRARAGKKMSERLANELLEALNNAGSSIKKKEDLHKMAEANRAFAHYRW
jgi:small subunit ribosomal protein S7